MVASFTYNIILQQKYNHYTRQDQDRNYSDLRIIADNGKNLAGRLEGFINTSEVIDSERRKTNLDSSWRSSW